MYAFDLSRRIRIAPYMEIDESLVDFPLDQIPWEISLDTIEVAFFVSFQFVFGIFWKLIVANWILPWSLSYPIPVPYRCAVLALALNLGHQKLS